MFHVHFHVCLVEPSITFNEVKLDSGVQVFYILRYFLSACFINYWKRDHETSIYNCGSVSLCNSLSDKGCVYGGVFFYVPAPPSALRLPCAPVLQRVSPVFFLACHAKTAVACDLVLGSLVLAWVRGSSLLSGFIFRAVYLGLKGWNFVS